MSSRDLEKHASDLPDSEHGAAVHRSDSEIEKEGGNLILVIEDAAAAGLKTAKDGKVRVYPCIAAFHLQAKRSRLAGFSAQHSPTSLLSSVQTVLVPQPSDDPRDPLNWPEWKKTAILLLVAFAAFVGDFQSGAGIPLLPVQGEEWGLSPNKVNEAGNLCVLDPRARGAGAGTAKLT